MTEELRMSDISVMRPGEERDISSLVVKVFNEFVSSEHGDEGLKTFLSFAEPDRFSSDVENGCIVLVARVSKKIVGIIKIRDNSHIGMLFVDPAYHKRGIAKSLWAKAREICLSRKSSLIRFTVSSSTYAVPIYEKMGFSVHGIKQTKDGIVFTPMICRV